MIIANKVKEYSTSYNFLMIESNVEEIKKVFDEMDFKKAKDIEKLNFMLIEDGITDEEIIEAILEQRKGNFIVEFIDNRQDGFFKIFEIEENIIIPIYYSEDIKAKTKHYDFEEMANVFENKLALLDNEVVVMCSVDKKDNLPQDYDLDKVNNAKQEEAD